MQHVQPLLHTLTERDTSSDNEAPGQPEVYSLSDDTDAYVEKLVGKTVFKDSFNG